MEGGYHPKVIGAQEFCSEAWLIWDSPLTHPPAASQENSLQL